MIRINPFTLGISPSGYGENPPEGKKYFTYFLDFSLDQDWIFDFTLLQEQARFSYLQTVMINATLLKNDTLNMFINGQNQLAIPDTAIAPLVYPIFSKNPVIIELKSATGAATGSTVVTFANFAVIPVANLG